MRIATSQKVAAAFVLALLPLLVIGWFSYQTPRQFIALSESSRQSQQVLERLATFMTHLNDIETGQRGYLLTGDERYLEPFNKSKDAIEPESEDLCRLTDQDAEDGPLLSRLHSLARLKIAELGRTIEIRGSDPRHGFDDALKIVKTDAGKELMDEMRRVVAELRDRAIGRRDRAFKESDAVARRLVWIATLVSPLAVILMGLSVWVILHDVAGRSRAEAEVRRQRAILQTVLAGMGEGLVVADTQGRFQVFNPMAHALLGIGAGDDAPEKWSSCYGLFGTDGTTPFPAEELPLVQALHGRSVDNLEMIVRRDGATDARIISMTGRPIADESGGFHGGVVVFHDVTEQKRAEQTLRESESRFRLMVKGVKDYAIIMLDPQGCIAMWNEGAQRIKGYRAEEIVGQHFSCFYPQAAIDAGFPEKELSTAAAEGRFEDDGWRLRKDGSRFWANVIITALRDDGGKLIGFSKITRDLTDRMQAEQALLEKSEMLKQSNAELEQFAYVASHDLKEPLRMVASYTGLLAEDWEGKLGAEADQYIRYAVEGAKRMQALIDDLLNYARVGRIGGRTQRVDLQQLAETVLANLEESIHANGAGIEIGELPTVMGNPMLLGQLLQNLIANAIKFHGNAPPVVQVSSFERGDQWLFAVKDNGIGIEPQYAERIFEVFQRLHGRGEYEGTGIGLAICRKVVEQHGGRIWVESQPGQGSTFYFTMPAEQVTKLKEKEVVLV
jgi:PAS domain S-box-containing protein